VVSASPVPSPSGADRPLLAIGFRTLAMVLLSSMLMMVKIAGQRGVASGEIMFWRQAVAALVVFAVLAASGKLSIVRTRRIGSHARRAVIGTVALFCNVTAALLLPLAEATTLGFTTPLFAVIIAALVMRQPSGPWRWTAVVLGFAGVLIIAQPGHHPVSGWGVLAGLGSGLLVAAVSFQIRDLARTEPPITCVFWFSFFGAAIMAVALPATMTRHDPFTWLLLGAIGTTGAAAQWLMTTALRHGQVATVVVMDYTALIWATLYGTLIWGQLPTMATWLGAPLIIAAGLVITWREHRLAHAVPPTSALEED